jgi:hypothetical protein
VISLYRPGYVLLLDKVGTKQHEGVGRTGDVAHRAPLARRSPTFRVVDSGCADGS